VTTGTSDATGATSASIPGAPGTSQTVTGSLPSTGSTAIAGPSGTTATTGTTGTASPATSSAAGGTTGTSTSAAATPTSSTSSTSSTSGTSTTSTLLAYGEAMVSWIPPSENTDGSTLTDLTGFTIYYGQDPQNLDQVLTLDCHWCLWTRVSNLGSGTWYFAVKSFNKTGIQSAFSRIMSKTIA
jgi:hypothetical protein